MSQAKHTFFCKDPDFGVLNEHESHHATKVLRLMEGDFIRLLNGKGRMVLARITSLNRKEMGFEIIQEIEQDVHPLRLHIAIAPPKNIDRFQFFLEKVTEMGISEITPIITGNSERNILKIDKLRSGLISALKQSGNLYLPILHEPIQLKEFFTKSFENQIKAIAFCSEDEEKVAFKTLVDKNEDHIILIGPEGDFSPEEIILAKEKGFKGVSLGNSRLRTETAGILACHTVYLQY